MKTNQLTNLKRTLETFKSDIGKRIDAIDRVLAEIYKIENMNEKRCKKCLGRDLRMLKDSNYFCRTCGFDTRNK